MYSSSCFIILALLTQLACGQEVVPVTSLPGNGVSDGLIVLALNQVKEAGVWNRRTKTVVCVDLPPMVGLSQEDSVRKYQATVDAYLAKENLDRIPINTLYLPDITGVPVVNIRMIRFDKDRVYIGIDVTRQEREKGKGLLFGLKADLFTQFEADGVSLVHAQVGREVQRAWYNEDTPP